MGEIMVKLLKKSMWIAVLAMVASLTLQPIAAQAADPCHPDTVGMSVDAVTITQPGVQVLNGTVYPGLCAEFDPGWVAFGYLPPNSATVTLTQLYIKDWQWGGEVDYNASISLFKTASVDTTKLEIGGSFYLLYFRGGDPAVSPADLTAYTLSWIFKVNPATPAELAAAEKAAADKAAAEKAAAEKAAADKAAADKAAADKAAADKAAADKAAADKAAADKAAADKAAADKAAADKAAADKAAAAAKKKTTISCVKGKVTKKVSGINPKCPAGYKKK